MSGGGIVTALHHRIRNGMDLQIGDTPLELAAFDKPHRKSAILGRDFPCTRLETVASEGQNVRAGQPLLRDRDRHDIVFVSPLGGTLTSLQRGPRRAIVALEITQEEAGEPIRLNIPDNPGASDIRKLMLESGLWTAMKNRPFDCVANPEQEPEALLVTAIDTQPLAPDPATIIAHYGEQFSLGLEALEKLVHCRIYLCKHPDANIPLDEGSQIQVVNFAGAHPAGLPGTHIHTLCPIGFDGKFVWHIGYQDVISLGYLMATGCGWYERVVSIAGQAISDPKLVRVPLGANISDLVGGELVDGLGDGMKNDNVQVISGSVLSGHSATGPEAYLGQRHYQITALPGSVLSSADRLPGPMLPLAELERAAPPGILVAPLLRALLVGDIERASELGALELVEEDLALLSYLCSSGNNYGKLLRDVLDQLYREGISSISA